MSQTAMFEPNKLIQALEKSGLSQAHAAAAALRAGWRIEGGTRSISCKDLLSVYKVRLQLIRKKTLDHAVALANSTDELVRGLHSSAAEQGSWISLRGQAEHRFCIFLSGDDCNPIGCLRVISRLDVSDSRWTELWDQA